MYSTKLVKILKGNIGKLPVIKELKETTVADLISQKYCRAAIVDSTQFTDPLSLLELQKKKNTKDSAIFS